MLTRMQAVERADFFWNDFPNDLPVIPLESMDGQKLRLTALALEYVEGDRLGALAATCRNLAAWRRMTPGTNSLLRTLMASVNMKIGIELYANMLAGLPADAAVPQDCAQALQPVVAADVDRCAAGAGEFAWSEEYALRTIDAQFSKATGLQRVWLGLIFNMQQSEAQAARPFAASCGSDAITRLLADELPDTEPAHAFLGVVHVPPSVTGLECLANVLGCVFLTLTSLNHERYGLFALDHAAHLRLAATLLWLRQHPGGSIAERFAHRPAELRSPHHDSGYDAEHGVLYVEDLYQYRTSNGEKPSRFELPVVLSR